jgi:4a-hydroxytetrahydrobiopterin dehydratase
MDKHDPTLLHLQKCSTKYNMAERLKGKTIYSLLSNLVGWEVIDEDNLTKLRCTFLCRTFSGSVSFVNDIAKISEEQNHHPKMIVEYNKVTVIWWTHELSGLHHNDFIMAAKCSRIASRL